MQIENSTKIKEYLKKHPVDKLFSFDILPYLELHRYKKGEFICREFEHLSHLYLFTEGTVKVYATLKNGKVTMVELISGTGIVGELEMLDAQTKTQAVQAIGDVTCFALPLDRCKKQIMEDVFFLRELCRMLSGKIVKNKDIFSVNQSYPLKNRLAAYILLTQYDFVFDQRLTDASEYLGTSYRHLLRTLKEFTLEGILKKSKKGYFIKDIKTMELLAGEID